MIYIEESIPRKLSGQTALHIRFPYNEELVSIIKEFYPAVWFKKELYWEVGINYLSKLLDTLTFYDDIELSLLDVPETSEISNLLTEQEISSFKYKPFEHQIEGINFLLNKKRCLLLDNMGVGKTLESMYTAEVLHDRGEIEHCLVICGVDSLRQNWKAEITKFSKKSVVVLGERVNKNGKIVYESLAKRAEQLRNKIEEFFIVVNITNIRDDKFIEAFNKSENKIDMIIFDEAHRATKGSTQGSNLLKLDAKYKIAMTGTPLVNTPISAYLSLSWTGCDHATLTNFKQQYCNFGGFNNSQVIGYKNLDLLKDELKVCSLRRTFDQVRGDMPTKNIEYELVEMSDEHRKFYEAIKAGVKEEADKINLNANNLLALTTRLRQATSAPSVLTSNNIDSSKIDRAIDLAEDLLEQGEKVIIFSTFIEPCEVLHTKLQRFHSLIATGNQSEAEVSKSIDLFRNSKDYNLLIGTTGKVGTGFSMPECHYAIFIDQPFTYAMFSQACDRIYRITSEQPVFIKVLACKDTIDERVKEIVDTKKDLSDFVIDNIENSLSESLSSELLKILQEI